MAGSQKKVGIGEFILKEVEAHSADLANHVAQQFNISRQRANTYISREVKAGGLIKVGTTRNSRYFLLGGNHFEFSIKITSTLTDDYVWSKYVKPMLANCPQNVLSACAYGFTEIFNNAIDHSEGSSIYTQIDIKDGTVDIIIMDNGIGIFKKIQIALSLEHKREAILHLSKGKFTTDPDKHTGEGIFFTSRMFDKFSILSDDLHYTFHNKRDWMLSNERQEEFGRGTSVEMSLALDSKINLKGVFDKYKDEDIGFAKTVVAVALSADPGDPHVSRSQAKRLLMGLEKFRHVVLDFKGVESVGQAFVDQVFRVFQAEYPKIKIQYFNANPQVDSMIKTGLPKGTPGKEV